jgi:hypothetical protein
MDSGGAMPKAFLFLHTAFPRRPMDTAGRFFKDREQTGRHHAQTIAITGRSYRLKDHAAIAGKEDKNKKIKSKPNEPSTAEPAS